MSDPAPPSHTRLGAAVDVYRPAVRRAIRLVRRVPRGWPAPLRRVVQVVLAVVAVVLVLAVWILRTAVVIVRLIGGTPSQGGSPSGPTRGPLGRA